MTKIFMTIVLVMLVLSGCASIEPTRFYLLSPRANPVPVTGDIEKGNVTIVIAAIRLPEYLNRYQIVTRVSDNELELGWQDRWAESLERNFTRILAQNVEQLLLCRCTSAPAPKSPTDITYRLEADVIRMDGVLGEKAYLDVWWSVYTPEKKLLLSRRSSFVQPVEGRGYEAFVQAQSTALFDFSRELAAAIAKLQKVSATDKRQETTSR